MSTMHYLYKLIPPRPTFAADMTDVEAAVMAEHATYWSALVAEGGVVAFGPVLDPVGVWGLAIVEADDEAAVHEIGAEDPAVTSNLATFDVYPMPSTIVRAAPEDAYPDTA